MYVIGRSKGDYIRLVNSKGIEYSHSINLASIFTSLEKAELMILIRYILPMLQS